MRTARSLSAGGVASAVALVLALGAGMVKADVATERPGSILIFPKVVNTKSTEARTTVIQVANTSNLTRYARCFYINGAPQNPNLPADPVNNPASCNITDFELTLTRQQPTHWLVKTGRHVNPADKDTGIDPGAIPPVPNGFTGELICVEVDASGAPIAGNSLVGEATIGDMRSGDVSKYNAITIKGIAPNDDLDLALDNQEYNACPEQLAFDFQAEGGSDAVIDALGGGASQVNSNLTLVPCSQDLDNLIGGRVTVQFDIRNEFEEALSASTTVECWQSLNLNASALNDAFGGSLGTMYGTARISPVGDDGVLGVASTRRTDTTSGANGSAAVNLHMLGNNPSANTDALIRMRGL